MRVHHPLPSLLLAALVLGACASDAADAPPTDPITSDVASPVTFDEDVTVLEPPDDLEVAEVPDELVAAVVDDVAARAGVAADEPTVVVAGPVEWASQQLGCVLLDQPSDPTPVDGYRIVIDVGGVEFDYRLDDAGEFHLCGDPVDLAPDDHDEGDDHGDPEHLDEETS